MSQSLFKQAKDYLREHLYAFDEIETEEKNYRYEHSLRVFAIGMKLCEEEQGDPLVTGLACILHDLGKFDSETNIEHGRVSAHLARPFLEKIGLSSKQIDDICYAIAVHVDGKAGYAYPHTLEAMLVSDADNIDRFDIIRILFIANDDKQTSQNYHEMIQKMESRSERLRGYLEKEKVMETSSGDHVFKEKVRYMLEFNQRYLAQLKRTDEGNALAE